MNDTVLSAIYIALTIVGIVLMEATGDAIYLLVLYFVMILSLFIER